MDDFQILAKQILSLADQILRLATALEEYQGITNEKIDIIVKTLLNHGTMLEDLTKEQIDDIYDELNKVR